MREGLSKGVAFIFEGDTEKVFYLVLLEYFCEKNPTWTMEKAIDKKTGEISYYLFNLDHEQKIVVKLFVVGAVSQLVNSQYWFENNCHKAHPALPWVVFLCYDTDNYKSNITKFYEGDWKTLRKQLHKNRVVEIVDLAAKADIEDILLIDSESVFCFLGKEPGSIPNGTKGKSKMKKIFRAAGTGIAYHEGKRAEPLIRSLDLRKIIEGAPLDLKKIEQVCFQSVQQKDLGEE